VRHGREATNEREIGWDIDAVFMRSLAAKPARCRADNFLTSAEIPKQPAFYILEAVFIFQKLD
jgi:hypothetical protein